MTLSSRGSLRPSVQWQGTVRSICVAGAAVDASPARTGEGVPRRAQLCGGPSLARPALRRGCGEY
jgi:hypothetical protein